MVFHIETPTVEVRFDLTSRLPPVGTFSWKLAGIEPFVRTSQFLYSLTYLFPEMIQILKHQNKPTTDEKSRPSNFQDTICKSNKLSSQELLDGFVFHVLSTGDGPVVAWRPSEAVAESEWVTALVNSHDLDKVAKQLCSYYADIMARNDE